MFTDSRKGFQVKEINCNDYKVRFRRWLLSEIDNGKMYDWHAVNSEILCPE